jgi:hypothetical protein
MYRAVSGPSLARAETHRVSTVTKLKRTHACEVYRCRSPFQPERSDMSTKTTLVATVPSTPVKTAPGSIAEPTPEEIASRAYELFVESGSEDGHDMEHWLRAEAELKARKKR